jgi:hypothetical protein
MKMEIFIREDTSHRCFKCKRKLYFDHVCTINTSFSFEALEKLWNSPHVQFLCCECYNLANGINNTNNVTQSAIKRQKEQQISQKKLFELLLWINS